MIALEIGTIEREEAIDCVDVHDGNQTGVIDLYALNAVVLDNLFPDRVNRGDVRRQSQQALDATDFPLHFLVREPESIHPSGTSGDVPKFSDVLGQGVPDRCSAAQRPSGSNAVLATHSAEHGEQALLGTEEDGIVLPQQLRDRVGGLRAEWMAWLGAAQENIRVNKDTHQLRHDQASRLPSA